MSSHSPKTITATELKSLSGNQTEAVILDVLFKDRYQKKHIPGAKQACVFEVSFMDQVKAVVENFDATIVVYGSSDGSMDAVTAAEKLHRAGYADVYVLEGGFSEWQKGGYPIEGDDPGFTDPPAGLPHIENGAYRVDTDASTIEWAGRNPNSTHHGTLDLADGAFTVQQGEITGLFEIDMTSIRNKNLEGDPLQTVLEDHLKSDDFFFVHLFPKAVFTMTGVTLNAAAATSTQNATVEGEFELRGVHKDLTFPATIAVKPDGDLSIEAHFDIDRTRWNVIYGSSRFFEHLGMHMVFDTISVALRINAKHSD